MNKLFYLKFIVMSGLLAITGLHLETAIAEPKGEFTRKVLMEKPVELPSNMIHSKIMKVSIPAGFKTPDHTHDGPGPRYVVKGKLKVVEGGKTATFSAGDVFWETGDVMSVENIGKGTAELIIFELAQPKQSEKK